MSQHYYTADVCNRNDTLINLVQSKCTDYLSWLTIKLWKHSITISGNYYLLILHYIHIKTKHLIMQKKGLLFLLIYRHWNLSIFLKTNKNAWLIIIDPHWNRINFQYLYETVLESLLKDCLRNIQFLRQDQAKLTFCLESPASASWVLAFQVCTNIHWRFY